MTALQEVREFPGAKHPFLRVQVGWMQKRLTVVPIYDDRVLCGHTTGDEMVPVFHLAGCGETLEKAQAMAGVQVQSPESKVPSL
jgi:hypothetical protein